LAELDVEELAENEDAPEHPEHAVEMAEVCDEVGADASSSDHDEGAGGEDGVEDDAADEFADFAFATKAVDEDAPAKPGDGGELGTSLSDGPTGGRS